MKRPDINQKKEYFDIVSDSVSIVPIPGTKKTVRMRWIKPYTMERLTSLWIERDLASASVRSGGEVLKDLAKEPYFAFKEAALMILNNDLKIRFLYPLYWRWLAHRYDETQMVGIIAEGKKKLPLLAHYETMAYSTDMRTDAMKMTKAEAEQFRQELISATKQPSLKSSPDTGAQDGVSEDGNGTSGTGVSSPAPK